MVKHYLKLGYVFYKNHITFTKDLHTFLHIFEFNKKLNYLLIRVRPISIIHKHRLEERITKRGYICFLFTF